MNNSRILQPLSVFYIALLIPYSYYFFTITWGNLVNSSGLVLAVHDSLIVTLGLMTLAGLLIALYRNKKPSQSFLILASVIAHIFLWIAMIPLIFIYDKGIITYALAGLIVFLASRSVKEILHQKAKILLTISCLVIIFAGHLSYKEAFCWRKMLSYEKSHQKELATLYSAEKPWQWEYLKRCKLTFNFRDSLMGR